MDCEVKGGGDMVFGGGGEGLIDGPGLIGGQAWSTVELDKWATIGLDEGARRWSITRGDERSVGPKAHHSSFDDN